MTSSHFNRVLSRLPGITTEADTAPLTSYHPKPPVSAIRAGDLDTPLLQFSPKDTWTLSDACEGAQIFGGTGSGRQRTGPYTCIEINRIALSAFLILFLYLLIAETNPFTENFQGNMHRIKTLYIFVRIPFFQIYPINIIHAHLSGFFINGVRVSYFHAKPG